MADVTKEIALKVGLQDNTASGASAIDKRLEELRKKLLELAAAGKQNTDEFKKTEQQIVSLGKQVSALPKATELSVDINVDNADLKKLQEIPTSKTVDVEIDVDNADLKKLGEIPKSETVEIGIDVNTTDLKKLEEIPTSETVKVGVDIDASQLSELSAVPEQITVPVSAKVDDTEFQDFRKEVEKPLPALPSIAPKDSDVAKYKSARAELRAMREQLLDMSRAGLEGTQAFNDLQLAAGRLQDEISDTGARIKGLASDTRNIDTFIGAIQGITAGFQIAQGAAALFGDENEELQKTLVKVQGAMALANGVQQVANLLQKESALMLGLNQAAINANTIAQKAYTIAVGTSTGALKAFRLALAATGIGAVVAVVATLTIALSKLKTEQDRAAESAKKQAKAEDELTRSLARTEKQVELNVLRAKNAGKTEAEVAKIEADGYNKRAEANNKFIAKTTALLEQSTRRKIAEEVRAANPIEGETARERYLAREQQARALSLALTEKSVADRIKVELAGNKELNDKLTQAEFDALLNREKALAAVKPTKTEAKESPEIIRIRREIELMQAKGADEAKLHVKRLEQIDAEIKAAKNAGDKAELHHKRKVEIESENNRLLDERQKLEAEGFEKTVAGLQYNIQLMQAQGATEAKLFEATIQAIGMEREAVKNLTDEKTKALKLDELAKVEAIAVATEQTRLLELQKDVASQIAELKQSAAKEEANRAIEAKKLTEDAISAETFVFNQRKALLEAERIQRLEALQLQYGDSVNFKQLEQALNDEYRQKELTAEQEYQAKKQELKMQERDTTLKFANEAFTGVLGFIAATQGESEADARRAFNLNKAAGIADATVNTFLGASQALRDPKLPTLAKAFAVAGIITSGLAQVRKIAATQFKASGGGGGGTEPSGNIVPSGGSETPAPPVFSNPNVTDLSGFGGGQAQGSQPMRAYVVERDIQQTTSRVRRLSEFATLG